MTTDVVLDNPNTAYSLTMNGTISGTPETIDAVPMVGSTNLSTDHDWFKVTLFAGNTYTFGASVISGLATEYLGNAAIDLRNSTGTEFSATFDDAVAPTFTYKATATGTFFLAISAGTDDTSTDPQFFNYSISVLQNQTAPGANVVDPFVPYTDLFPGTPFWSDVVSAALQYVGKQWAWDNCTGLVWAIGTEVGGNSSPFYEPIQTVTKQTISTIPSIIPDDGYVTPTPGATDGAWATFNSTHWTADVQLGDIVRIPKGIVAGLPEGHSFVVVAGNQQIGWSVIDDTDPMHQSGNPNSDAPITISEHTYNGSNILYGEILRASDVYISRLVSSACFCRGTLILTEVGEKPVEDLAIRDKVVTTSGAAKPVKWIGRRAYDGRFIGGNREILPICVGAGAIADCVPTRDLWVSPEHALYINDFLVPAGLLVNGATIAQAKSVQRVEYFHIELASHEIIFAEGAPAETYVDCDNRRMFQNSDEFAAFYPDDLPAPWDFCAPRLEANSPELAAIRGALLRRTEALGYRLTDDPDLHLVVDGEPLGPNTFDVHVWRFSVPAGSRSVWLASRSSVPAEIDAAARDHRRLGVVIRHLALYDGQLTIEARHDYAGLGKGFHDDEATHRWTDGRARLPDALMRPFAGPFTLEVHLAPSGLSYRLPPPSLTSGVAA